jgi:hypothetical protein
MEIKIKVCSWKDISLCNVSGVLWERYGGNEVRHTATQCSTSLNVLGSPLNCRKLYTAFTKYLHPHLNTIECSISDRSLPVIMSVAHPGLSQLRCSGTRGSGGQCNYRILKFVQVSFGLHAFLLTGCCILDPCHEIWQPLFRKPHYRVVRGPHIINVPLYIFSIYDQVDEVRECLLSFGAESVVFQVAIQKLKDQDI